MVKNKVKKDKKRIVVALLLIAVILCAVILSLGGNGSASSDSLSRTVKNNDERIAYLKTFGWDVVTDPVEEISVVIPKTFDDVFSNYNVIQKQQGFDLSQYSGLEAVRYTYSITNYPTGEKNIVADIIVYRSKVIAGDVQSTAMNGFMHGLKYPESNQSESNSSGNGTSSSTESSANSADSSSQNNSSASSAEASRSSSTSDTSSASAEK